jgi:alkanesulfonate monooxygenase SsuD/methylene tetrahydromethanopterin reductase-like flavin-dependent oxidoreductase (luciferase family)
LAPGCPRDTGSAPAEVRTCAYVRRVEISVCLDSGRPWSEVARLCDHAERRGLHTVWFSDHFMPHDDADRSVAGPVLECWTSLAALAGATKNVRLGSLVLDAGYRHPAVLSNMAASLDQVSNGRLTLGMGAGWQVNEHAAYGIPLPAPGPRLHLFEEYLSVVRSMLRNELTTYHGTVFQLSDARCAPSPVQAPLPILVGGGGEQRTMQIAARLADQWHVWGPHERFAAKSRVMDARCAEIGRDPAEVWRVSGEVIEATASTHAIADLLQRYAAASCDEFIIRDHRDTALPDELAVLDLCLAAVERTRAPHRSSPS